MNTVEKTKRESLGFTLFFAVMKNC